MILRLMVMERVLHKIRRALSHRRDNPQALEMLRLCGEIEQTLYHARQHAEAIRTGRR